MMNVSKLLSYRDNPELKKFVLRDVKRTGRSLGYGSFGSVEELTIGGTYYAGKKLHNALLDDQYEGRSQLLERMITECKLMSDLRHPNIVQFIGICFFDDYYFPVLVMEQLATNLDDLLVKKAGNLSLAEKLHILHDVTKGLVYLHERSPPIIHRDLTTRNVLINSASMQAKIADLGNALIINPTKISSMLSQTPGTLVYMPPEATPLNPRYDSSLDMFSFGQLALHTIIQVFPVNLLPSTYEDPETEELRARSEVERRGQYFDMLYEILPKKHILSKTIKQCLSNKTIDRPTATKVVKILEDCLGKPDFVESSSSNEGATSTTRLGEEYLKLYKSRIEQLQRGTPGILEIYRSHGNSKFHRGKRSEWKQYVFQIANIPSSPTPHLTFFKSNQEGAAVDQLQLADVHTVRATATPFQNDDTSRFYFVAISNEKSWLLRAYSQEDCVCWMEAIKSGCSTNITKKTPPDANMDLNLLFEPAWYSSLVHIPQRTHPGPFPPRKPARLHQQSSASVEATPTLTETTPTREQLSGSSGSSWDSVEELYDDTAGYQVPQASNQNATKQVNLAQRYEMSDALQNSSSSGRKVPPPVKKRHLNPMRKAKSQPSLADKPKTPPKPAPRSQARAHAGRASVPDQDLTSFSKSNRKPSLNDGQYEFMKGGSSVEQLPSSKKSPYTEPIRIGPRINLKPPLPSVPPPESPPDSDDFQQDDENVYEDLDKYFDMIAASKIPPVQFDPNQTLLGLKAMRQPIEYCDFIPAARNPKPVPDKKLPPLPDTPKKPKRGQSNKKVKIQDKKAKDGKSLKLEEEVTKYINVRKDSTTDEEKPYDDTRSMKTRDRKLKKAYVNMFEEEFQNPVRETPPPLPPKPTLKLKPTVPPKPGAEEIRKRSVTFSANSQRPSKKKAQQTPDHVEHKRSMSDVSESKQEQLPPRNILRPQNVNKLPVPRPRSQLQGTG